jgi:hypothetical protein
MESCAESMRMKLAGPVASEEKIKIDNYSMSQEQTVETLKAPLQCEGWRRKGGAFSFGPPVWTQCPNPAVVLVTLEQDKKVVENSPACLECWKEGVKLGLKQLGVTPVMD